MKTLSIKIPLSSRKKALLVIDVQPAFINERNDYIIENISQLLAKVTYNAYVEATFHAEKGSLWEKQQQWTCPEGERTQTIDVIASKLKLLKPFVIKKETKSAFKGDKDVLKYLKKQGIEEIHIVGVDINDCVLATAYEAFDLGFITYVIEECSQSSSSELLHQQALKILQGQNMTNNSCSEDVDLEFIKTE